MAIDDSVGMFNENAGTVYNAREYRRLFSRMLMGWDLRTAGGTATEGTGNGGVARAGDYAVSERAAGANMSVDVAPGALMVGGTENAYQGEYFVFNDAVVNVAIAAADPTNARIDLVGVRVRDSEYSGAANDAAVIAVTGTPAASPAEPTPPENFVTLARVDVPAADTAIGNAQITDRRRRISALGGLVVCTSSSRPTVGLWEGQQVYETDTDALLYYDGSAWKRTGHDVPHSTVTRVQMTGTRNTSSTTYGAIPTQPVNVSSFVKHRADTKIIARIDATNVFRNTSAGNIYFGVYNGTTTTDVCMTFHAATAFDSIGVSGAAQITGMAAGTYTFSVYWRTSVTTDSAGLSSDSTVALEIAETL